MALQVKISGRLFAPKCAHYLLNFRNKIGDRTPKIIFEVWNYILEILLGVFIRVGNLFN